ncbi:MAG TPA: endo-1,4-beta-xylanase [Bacteroidales bacterium]|nr:endo-1,4-beta-xylanase [Bacteroidales bacterium]
MKKTNYLLFLIIATFITTILSAQDLPVTVEAESGTTDQPSNEPTNQPLAAGKSKFLGSEWDYNQAPHFFDYWNQATPGNAGKWGSVESTRDVMNWTVLDSTYNVAKRHHGLFKEHTLIWGAQQPSWIGSLDTASQRQEIEEWFAALANRYDSIDYIDVVNEPMHNAPNGMLPWELLPQMLIMQMRWEVPVLPDMTGSLHHSGLHENIFRSPN